MKSESSGIDKNNKQRRFLWQAAALILVLIAPFLLFFALQAGQTGFAIAAFALIVAGIFIIIGAG